MDDLVKAITEAGKGLEKGDLGMDGLEKACADARELYERLIVLRHKARESMRTGGSPRVTEQEPSGTHAIRLDTRPPDISPRQTSLIDAIEDAGPEPPSETHEAPAASTASEEKTEEPPRPRPSTTKAPRTTTLAEKLEKSTISSLPKAITLSHKFWFVSELFNGDRIRYEKSIERIDKMNDRNEAELFLQQEVVALLKKPADPEALSIFMELIERRFQ